jgi:hypothetical protein
MTTVPPSVRGPEDRSNSGGVSLEFHDYFSQTTETVNSMSGSDERIIDALRRYDGRSIVLKVRNDAVYVFNISTEGVDYQLDPATVPDDMYAEMSMPQAKKLVYRHSLGLMDMLTIKHRNITMADVNFAKMLFGG